jgi:Ala-tRNA(Pro) deacylase
MTCKERIESYLRAHQVAYETQQHARAYTAQEVAASEHLPGRMVAKVVMVLADGQMTMLVVPADRRVDLAKVARALGVQDIWLADEREFTGIFPDCEVGAMPPFGNLYGLPVYVDRALAEDDTIVFQAGTHTETMQMKYADYDRLLQPAVIEIVRDPQSVVGS